MRASHQHLVEAAVLALAGEEGNAHGLRGADVGRQFRQHGDAAGDVEAADADLQAGLQERAGKIDRARKLVGLHPHQPDQRLAALAADQLDDLVGADPPVGLVIGMQADFDVRPKRLALAHVFGKRIEAGQRIGRDRRADPLDRVALVVVMRRLDHHEMEQFRSHAIPSERPKCRVRRHPNSFCQITARFCRPAGAPPQAATGPESVIFHVLPP